MGFLMSLHGEIAGLHSSFYPYSEGGITGVNGGAGFVKRGVWAYTPRSDARGYGGNYAFAATAFGMDVDLTFNESGITGKTAVELFARIPMHKNTANDGIFRFWYAGANAAHCYAKVAFDGTLQIYTDETYRVGLAGVIPNASSKWPVLTVWVRIHASTGWIKVYKDFDYTAPILEYTGAVYRTWGAPPASVNKINMAFGGSHWAIDDMKCNDITMSYSGGAGGTIAVGDTITGNVSSSTAVVTRVDGDNTSGVLQLTLLKDGGVTAWNGLQDDDPFAGDASISNGGGWSANISGLDPESGLPGDSYFGPAMLPDSNGFVDTLTESPVQTAGNEWKVYIYDGTGGSTPLGFGPNAEVSYGYATATAQEVLVNLAASAVPAAAMDGIEQLHVYAWAKKDGTGIDNAQLSVRSGSTTGYGETQSLGTAFGALTQRFRENPDTAAAWVPSELATVQAGISFPA